MLKKKLITELIEGLEEDVYSKLEKDGIIKDAKTKNL